MKQYKVGIYCRLSVDDANNSAKKNYIPADESVSIENQHEMLSKFCMINCWSEIKAYKDDGYSGGNFNRPAFLEMIEDARHGLINLILVKDLSRLGRDFVEVGRYTDVIFPSLGCRFVSVLQAKRKRGQYLTPYAPFGYAKDPERKNHIIIDSEKAEIVRRIYYLRFNGMSYSMITALLNEERIPTSTNRGFLQTQTVKAILGNEIYLGNIVINRYGHRSYKDKTWIQKPKSEWIRNVGTHEAIISRNVWEEVQKLNADSKAFSRKSEHQVDGLFSGKIYCADCGKGLYVTRSTKHYPSGTHVYVAYSCSTHQHSGRSHCSPHTISERNLLILEMKLFNSANAWMSSSE